jgi:hypothetical protein
VADVRFKAQVSHNFVLEAFRLNGLNLQEDSRPAIGGKGGVMWLTARTSGVPGQNGDQLPDSAATNSRTTRYLCTAAHLRRPMLPDKVIDPGMTESRPPRPVGRAYALRVLSGPGGVIPTSSVDVRRVRRHCLLAVAQTTVRDLAALAVVAACFRVDPWGIGITLAVLAAAAIFTGHGRLFLPVTIAATICLVVAVVHGSPAERASLTVPLACVAICFGIYLLDVLLAIHHVRRILRRQPTGQVRQTARPPDRTVTFRTPAESEVRRWLYGSGDGRNGDGHHGSAHNGNGHNGNGHAGNGNGSSSREPDRDEPDRSVGTPAVSGPVRVYYGRNGIIGSGEPLRPLPLTVPLEKALDASQDIEPFTTSDLMGAISRHLLSQSTGDALVHGYAYKPLAANGTEPLPHEPGHFSYALPNLDVTSVVVSPIPEPDQLPHSPVTVFRLNYRDLPSDDELLDLADRSPSAHSERHYLRVSTSSWDGQLVTSVYVNLALQGHYLRVIMRPFVLAPLVFDLKAADDIAGWNPLILLFLAVSVTVRGFRNVAGKLGRGRAGTDKTDAEQPTRSGVRSTRESYARPYVNNIHQQEDSERAIRIIEQKVVSCSMEYLRKHNIDIEDYERQIQNIVQSYTIMGDGSITAGTFNNSQVASVIGQGSAMVNTTAGKP